jgi:voltage-gated potassium channel
MTKKIPIKEWQKKLHEIIFEADSRTGRLFDIVIICTIVISVIVVMLDSVESFHKAFGTELYLIEWIFTVLFTIEYVLRLVSVLQPLKYAKSFFGVVDLISIIPTYLSLILPGVQALLVIRVLRVLRIFRVLKLAQYLGEANILKIALKNSRRKILVFFVSVITLVIIFGSIMYLVEGHESGFVSIPHSIYWAIVTLTTVGYGDITPQSDLGKMISALVMILGYSILAVPTGIITAEIGLSSGLYKKVSTQACPQCRKDGHEPDAEFCKFCGSGL